MESDSQYMLGAVNVHQRYGLWGFIVRRKALLLAIVCGLGLIGLTVWFTYWLATQTHSCPEWAEECDVRRSVAWMNDRAPLVQGIVSTVHGIGLGILAYPAFIFAEAAIWPMLTHHPYDLISLDMYLSATRGSVPSLLQAIWNASTGKWSNVMVCVGLITLLTTADRIVVGQVYTQRSVNITYYSHYQGGCGIGLSFDQQYPPGPVPASVTSASSFFASWSKNLSTEPLPEMRDFIADRTSLAKVGSFSVSGIQVSKAITCSGRSLEIVDDANPHWFTVGANYPKTDSTVRLRFQPRLAVWVDSVTYTPNDPTRTITTLVFAAINGSIENGVQTATTSKLKNNKYSIHGISALECIVDVTLARGVINVGSDSKIRPDNAGYNVSALDTLSGPPGGMKNVAQWYGAVVTSIGTSIYGAQPLFENKGVGKLPATTTTEQNNVTPEVWAQADLINFIHVASGALALSMSVQWNKSPFILTSIMSVNQLIASSAWLLFLPAVAILLITVFLAWWQSHTYRNSNIREMRTAKTSDMIWSTQNQSMREGVEELRSGSHGSEKLDEMKVRYTLLADEHSHMGLTWDSPERQSGFGIPLKNYASYTSRETVAEAQEYV